MMQRRTTTRAIEWESEGVTSRPGHTVPGTLSRLNLVTASRELVGPAVSIGPWGYLCGVR